MAISPDLDSDPFIRQHCDNKRPHPEHYWEGMVAGGRWCAGTFTVSADGPGLIFDYGKPIGKVTASGEDDHGVWFSGTLHPPPRCGRKPLPRWAWLRRRRRAAAQERIRKMLGAL